MLIWFWDARTTYLQNVKNASYSAREFPSVCGWVGGWVGGWVRGWVGARVGARVCAYLCVCVCVRACGWVCVCVVFKQTKTGWSHSQWSGTVRPSRRRGEAASFHPAPSPHIRQPCRCFGRLPCASGPQSRASSLAKHLDLRI